MDEITRLVDQLERAYRGDPWYGASLQAALQGLDPATAARRALPSVHTIWEIVLHIASWQREVARRVRDGVAREPGDGDWPPSPEPSADAWLATLRRLEAAHLELIAALHSFPAERLHRPLGEQRDRPLGSGVSYYVMLHGVVQHTIAHTAQITLLRRALG